MILCATPKKSPWTTTKQRRVVAQHTTSLFVSREMTPVVFVQSTDNTNQVAQVESMYVLLGVVIFFLWDFESSSFYYDLWIIHSFRVLYILIVSDRHFRRRMSWLDSLSVTPRNPRIEYANRAHRRDNVQAEPKKPTIVRFKINGKVLRDED